MTEKHTAKLHEMRANLALDNYVQTEKPFYLQLAHLEIHQAESFGFDMGEHRERYETLRSKLETKVQS